MEKKILLKPGREKSVLLRHPWIFSGAIAQVEGDPESGETVSLCASDGQPLAKAAYSPHSSIRARVWSFNPAAVVDADFFRERLRQAVQLRHNLRIARESSAYRLVYAESDGIPGLIIDRYSDVLVVQLLTTGAEYWRDTIINQVVELVKPQCVVERSDVDVRELEGLPLRKGILAGSLPDRLVEIKENELCFLVDVLNGQKTGFFLDQRHNRLFLKNLAEGREVLNCFSYSGAFSVYALAGGASSVLAVDTSEGALELADKNLIINGFEAARHESMCADVFHALRKFRDQGRSFDLVILDPPKFAPTAAQAERAARGYKDINLLALKLLRPGGLLFTFSCSGGISADLFQKIVTGAALDAGVNARIVARLAQAPDHPVALAFPESAYLKGFVCSVDPWV